MSLVNNKISVEQEAFSLSNTSPWFSYALYAISFTLHPPATLGARPQHFAQRCGQVALRAGEVRFTPLLFNPLAYRLKKTNSSRRLTLQADSS